MNKVQVALNRLRREHGSWRKAEAATGINAAHLCQMANGKRQPSARVLALMGMSKVTSYREQS